MTDNEQEQIYSIALTMVPGIGHIGAKRLVEGMKCHRCVPLQERTGAAIIRST